jgi:hypothetical protein
VELNTDITFRLLGPYSQHFILFITYKWVQKAIVFVFSRLFEPSLMHVSKARAHPSEEHFNTLFWKDLSGTNTLAYFTQS